MRVGTSYTSTPTGPQLNNWWEVVGFIVTIPVLLIGGFAFLVAALFLLINISAFLGADTRSIASLVGDVVAGNAIIGLFAGAAIGLISPFSRSKFARAWVSAFFNRELAAGLTSTTYWGGVGLDGLIGMFVAATTGTVGAVLNPVLLGGNALAVVTFTFSLGGGSAGGGGGGAPPGAVELLWVFVVILAAAIIVGVLAGSALQIALMVLGGAVKGGMEASVARHPLGEGIGHGVRVALLVGAAQGLITIFGIHSANFEVLYKLAFPH